MMRSRNGCRRSAVVLALAASALLVPPAVSAASPAQPRVAARVRADARRGGRLHFLVLMRARAAVGARATPRRLVAGLRRTARGAQRPLARALHRTGASFRRLWIANAIAVAGSRRALGAVAHRADVRAIEPDDPVRGPQDVGPATPAPDATGVEWNVEWLKGPDVWALGDTGTGIIVGSADSGVQWDHPALRSHYRGWNGTSVDHNHNWWDAVRAPIDPKQPSPCGYGLKVPCDDLGHGTHTTGTMVGDDGAGNQVGVAPGAKWISCRNLDVSNQGRPSTYIGCLQWMLAPTDLSGADPDPSLKPDIVNNSYACPPLSEGCAPDSLKAAYDAMKAAGIFMATAAGNSGPGCSSVGDPPAIYDSAFTVGATSFRNNLIAFFSSRGPVTVDGSGRMAPEAVAPGSDVRSAYSQPADSYKELSGTSMAAPGAAGVVALLWSAFPELRGDVDQTAQILEATALHQPSSLCGSSGSPNNVYGYGTIDAYNAYVEAQRRFPPQLAVGDASIHKPKTGTATMTFDVSLSRASTEAVTVDYATADGTATASADYTATRGTVTLDSPQRSAIISVPIVGDDRRKADDAFRVVLSNPTNAAIARGSANGTIINEPAPIPPAETGTSTDTGTSAGASQESAVAGTSTTPGVGPATELPAHLFGASARGRDGTVVVALRVPSGGTVTALGTHAAPATSASALPRPSRDQVRWGPTRARAGAAGTVRLRLSPSGRAQRLYRRHRRRGKGLHVRVWATFTPNGGTPHTHAIGAVRVLRARR